MRGRLLALGLACALPLLCGSAAAEGSVAIAQLMEDAILTSRTAGDQASSPAKAKASGDQLQAELERAALTPAQGYHWAVEKDLKDGPSGAADMINAAAKHLKPDGIFVPGATATQGLEELKRMLDEGRVGVDALPATTLGIYFFGSNDPVGHITASYVTSAICSIVGERLCAAVLFHEVGHRMDPLMEKTHEHKGAPDMARVEREESEAFAMMQKYARGVYDTKEARETFGTTLQRLEYEQKQQPAPLRMAAISFMRTISEVYQAVDSFGRPDYEKLKALVRRLYKPDGSPASASA